MFESLVNQIDYEVVRKIFRVQVMTQPQTVSLNQAVERRGEMARPQPKATETPSAKPRPGDLSTFAQAMSGLPSTAPATVSGSNTPVHSQKVGRNDPCPCGSGKKYKKCCYPKYG
jgi:uncharacterized protein YecA (UPF0149 family)